MADSRGLRGSALEEMINRSNMMYRDKGLAMVQKVPTPITPIKIDKNTRQITLAYFEQKSTVDYIGVVQGIPICFDAKECKSDNFSLQNIHKHQYKFMQDYENQKGISFLLVFYTQRNEMFYIPFTDVSKFIERAAYGGIKHFKYNEINQKYKIRSANGIMIHYLEQIQMDLNQR